MNNCPSSSAAREVDLFEDEIFEDSSFMANFENSSFKETAKLLPDKSVLNISALCCDEELNGYDKLTGETWIYPTNYVLRDYQFNIIKSSLFKNTLVSLPTGLGKTFIAAVIMYNFYRWYPLGKIVFTAPTRPLVAQQIDACYNIVAIPPSDTIEMTGHMQVNTRKQHWQNKRVFFATPQVIYNDIKSGICPADKIRCLVIDEAHRARGNYAYCQIVSTLDDMGCKTYRLLALSATPGSKVDDVINVVKSLHIAHLELRTEACIDVAPYSHSRKINTVVIPLGSELTQLRQQYVEILDGYARRLIQLNILPHNLGNLSKGRIVMLYKEFQTKERGARHPQHNYIMKDFTLLIALYHGLELLVKHGSRVFLNFFDEHPEKTWIQSDDKLTALLERLRDDLGINPLSLDRSILPDGTIPEIPHNLCFGHPKFIKLKEIMLEHFGMAKQKGQDTRAIVFCEYRESVNLVHCLLLQCRPLIVPQMFVGQGASGKDGKTVVSQKQQIRVMRSFRSGAVNVLVATCVAEEGLDVGSVDLIVCFDISTRSPVRLVQRCGRTGRERGGQVHILVTEGREHQTLIDCMRQRDGLNKKILQSKEVESSLYKLNPRMLPHGYTPQCQKMYITVIKKNDTKDKKKQNTEHTKKGQRDLRTMLLGKNSRSSMSEINVDTEPLITTEAQLKSIFPNGIPEARFIQLEEHWSMSKQTIKAMSIVDRTNKTNLSSWLEWQRTLQHTVNIGHSKDTEILTTLLQFSDAKRFAVTQNPILNTQHYATTSSQFTTTSKQQSPLKTKLPSKKQKSNNIKSPAKNNGDIRALFSTATKSTKNYTKLISELGIQNNGNIPTSYVNLMVDLSLNNTNSIKTCFICQNVCQCAIMQNLRKVRKDSHTLLTFSSEYKLPDIDLIDEIDLDAILKCIKTDNRIVGDIEDRKKSDGLCENPNNSNFDLEFEFESLSDNNLENNLVAEIKNTPINKKCNNFDLGDIEDIFADSSPEEPVEKPEEPLEKPEEPVKNPEEPFEKPEELVDEQPEENNNQELKDAKEALIFFGLNSIDDIFADDSLNVDDFGTSESLEVVTNKKIVSDENDSQDDVIIIDQESTDLRNDKPTGTISPSILTGKDSVLPTSPIFCSQGRKFSLSTKKKLINSSTPKSAKKNLFPVENNNIPLNSAKEETMNESISIPNKSMFTITQLVDMINKTNDDDSNISKELNKDHIELVRSPSPILTSQAKKSNISDEVNKIDKIRERNNSPILLTQYIKNKPSLSEINTVNHEQERSVSPILLTQTNKKINSFNSTSNANVSLTILESDSDSDSTIEYNFNESNNNNNKNPLRNKRLHEDEDDEFVQSPHFIKKQKLETHSDRPITLQQKVIAALTTNNIEKSPNKNLTYHCSTLTNGFSQKENNDPNITNKFYEYKDKDEINNHKIDKLESLQVFRREKKLDILRSKFDTIFKESPVEPEISVNSNAIQYDIDSDDSDFVDNNILRRLPESKNKDIINHKTKRKKKRKYNEFLDLEAELSDDWSGNSGDELSDDSVGSIVDFICDENITHHEDMQALYIKSIKSPVRAGAFKIPQLTKKYEKADVFSQFVEEDAYEMDSFCVDSHIELTQANDVSELELAEIILENERKAKKRGKHRNVSPVESCDSPIVKRKTKRVKRLIDSDSDSS